MNEVDVHTGLSGNAGRLSKEKSKYVFSYRSSASEALSLTMPIRNESYQYHDLHPVFQMNLPEGALRNALELMIAKQYGSDDLTLLTFLGANQIGRIAYSEVDSAPKTHTDLDLSLNDLLVNEDEGLFDELMQRYAQSSGVAGVQPKVLFDVQERVTLPVDRYIVKGWGDEYPQLACNEFVCLSIARDAKLEVPEFYLSDNAEMLISKRFDVDEQGMTLGFEDFCVLQAKGTKQKYDSSLEACSNTIRHFVSPELIDKALYDFYKLTLLNIRIRNGDAHLKNSGVIYRDLANHRQGQSFTTKRQLAPIYDLISTVPYLAKDTMALSLTGSKRWPKKKVLEAFGRTHCQLSPKQLKLADEEVQLGIDKNQDLLGELSKTHSEFESIAKNMQHLMCAAY